MRRVFLLVTVLVVSVTLCVLAGCEKNTGTNPQFAPIEQQPIKDMLTTSSYALPMEFFSDQQYTDNGVLGEGMSYPLSGDVGQVLPPVRFFRIIRFSPRVDYIIQLPGSEGDSTADVRIVHHISGVFVVDNTVDNVRNPFFRSFTSRAVSNVMARRVNGNWRISEISPTDVSSTNDLGTTIQIEWMSVEGSSLTFPKSTLYSADTLLSLGELPAFAPGDTVRVQARAFSTAPDGCWLFLHVHSRFGASVFHMRIPFVRNQSDPTLFRAAWIVPEGIEVPRVFHMAVDGIGWDTLFGNQRAVYNSKMWSVPCLIGFPQLVRE